MLYLSLLHVFSILKCIEEWKHTLSFMNLNSFLRFPISSAFQMPTSPPSPAAWERSMTQTPSSCNSYCASPNVWKYSSPYWLSSLWQNNAVPRPCLWRQGLSVKNDDGSIIMPWHVRPKFKHFQNRCCCVIEMSVFELTITNCIFNEKEIKTYYYLTTSYVPQIS